MMIYNRKNRSGNVGTALALSTLGVTVSYLILNLSLNSYRTSLRNNQEAAVMFFAHSVANLLKQDLLRNYQIYSDMTNTAWSPCRPPTNPVSVNEYIKILSNPASAGAGCANVNFSLSQVNPITLVPTRVVASPEDRVQLGNLLGADTQFSPKINSGMSSFTTTMKLSRVNTDPSRNSLEGTIQLASNNSNFQLNKTIRLSIDIKKTIEATTSVGSVKKYCRDVAGAVCEIAGTTKLAITYLDSSGQIMKITDSNSVEPYGISVGFTTRSVKNLSDNPVTEYGDNSFCLPSDPNQPVPWILDAATDPDNHTYYLTVHGMLLDSTGTNVWTENDPKFVSIAHDNVDWLLLRSDGTVFSTKDIADLANYPLQEKVSIPTAIAITTGKGPAKCS